VEADGHLGVAFAALAVSLVSTDAPAEAEEALARAAASARSGTRRERQHVEVIGLLLAGDPGRARALAADHLAEFPADQLIRQLVLDGAA
jgi:DNA-binding GntR family transcriptional regulator